MACIDLVRRSWDAVPARAYRRELGISDGWGTAVTVQSMVFGNLGPRSGTGVVLTRHPVHEGQGLQLYGDFVVQGQGDDVVAGLVETFPITERQRRSEAAAASTSLERDFPAIHAGLATVARSLVQEHGMNHQEIEFTFEGDREEELFILQTRDTVIAPASVVAAFEPTSALARARLATGIGVGGGAITGRVAHAAGELAEVRARFPGEPILLLRPDTVPDDIPLVLQVDGLLTALGGATSHAAVAAKRLGKTCVVGCRPFEVHEWEGWSRLGGRVVRTGDVLSISGIDGAVYLGGHPTTQVRVSGRAQE
jgi:pyruvate,orthophosphate dikinase